MRKNIRLFFAVSLPERVKERIERELLPLIPKGKWRKVLPKNLHITMQFLGHLPEEAIGKLQQETAGLRNFQQFEAELNCIGHFKGRVLWVGTGKGTEEFQVLNNKMGEAIGTQNKRFHPHATLARNKGAKKQETQELVERLRAVGFREKIIVRGLTLFESHLHKAGPEYVKRFDVPFTYPSQPFH